VDDTTGPGATGDAGPDYERKYKGLQTAFQERQKEWATKEQTFEAQTAETEAKLARLAEYEARETAEREAAEFEAAHEQWAQDHNPTPGRHNEARGAGTSQEKTLDDLFGPREKSDWP
jgi:hypothetical protein